MEVKHMTEIDRSSKKSVS